MGLHAYLRFNESTGELFAYVGERDVIPQGPAEQVLKALAERFGVPWPEVQDVAPELAPDIERAKRKRAVVECIRQALRHCHDVSCRIRRLDPETGLVLPLTAKWMETRQVVEAGGVAVFICRDAQRNQWHAVDPDTVDAVSVGTTRREEAMHEFPLL